MYIGVIFVTCGLKKDLRNMAKFHQSTSLATLEAEVLDCPKQLKLKKQKHLSKD